MLSISKTQKIKMSELKLTYPVRTLGFRNFGHSSSYAADKGRHTTALDLAVYSNYLFDPFKRRLYS